MSVSHYNCRRPELCFRVKGWTQWNLSNAWKKFSDGSLRQNFNAQFFDGVCPINLQFPNIASCEVLKVQWCSSCRVQSIKRTRGWKPCCQPGKLGAVEQMWGFSFSKLAVCGVSQWNKVSICPKFFSRSYPVYFRAGDNRGLIVRSRWAVGWRSLCWEAKNVWRLLEGRCREGGL